MTDKDTLTVYWAPAAYVGKDSWSMLYESPSHVLNRHRQNKAKDGEVGNMFACPATSDAFKNVYQVSMTVDNTVEIPDNLERYGLRELIDSSSRIGASVVRKSSLEGYNDISINMSWVFSADEPVAVRFTAPYFPASSPAPDVLLTTGEYDIGSWFRPYNLNYLVPKGTSKLEFAKDSSLFYMDFKTEKKVVFKKFVYTDILYGIASECANAPARYGLFKSLKERYEDARRVDLQKNVLSEIKRNLIE